MPEVLGPLERRIMAHMWQSGPSTVAEARDALNKASSPRLAYTTVMTILVRLPHASCTADLSPTQ